MKCPYQCHEVGGPWIAENPDCPIHGRDAQAEESIQDRVKSHLHERIANAQTVEDLQACLHDILDLI